jgi:hypothetical protein
MTRILAFSGRKQSGKTTAGEYVVSLITKESLPISYKLYSFADPLKQDICMNLLGLTYEQCYGTDDDKNTLTNIKWADMPNEVQNKHTDDMLHNIYLTARQVMEVVGTEIFRKMYSNIWVDATINKIKNEKYDLAILLDNRFPNEVDSVLENDGLVIRLTRDLYKSVSEAESALDDNRYDWSRFSQVINNNNMTIEDKNLSIYNFLRQQNIL